MHTDEHSGSMPVDQPRAQPSNLHGLSDHVARMRAMLVCMTCVHAEQSIELTFAQQRGSLGFAEQTLHCGC